MQTFYEGWRIVQAVIAADGNVPTEVALPRPTHREVARTLVERRDFPVVDVVQAIEPIRVHAGTGTIGVKVFEQIGGVAMAIEHEAEAALVDAGFGPDRTERRAVVRRLFIPRLARIDRASNEPQRRVARQSDVPSDLLTLARALTQRRLLVTKLANDPDGDAATFGAGAATLEVVLGIVQRHWR